MPTSSKTALSPKQSPSKRHGFSRSYLSGSLRNVYLGTDESESNLDLDASDDSSKNRPTLPTRASSFQRQRPVRHSSSKRMTADSSANGEGSDKPRRPQSSSSIAPSKSLLGGNNDSEEEQEEEEKEKDALRDYAPRTPARTKSPHLVPKRNLVELPAPAPVPDRDDKPGFYLDADGHEYFLDAQGIEYYKDPIDGGYYEYDPNTPFSPFVSSEQVAENDNEHGTTTSSSGSSCYREGFYLDAEGETYYLDKHGIEYYKDDEDGEYYADENTYQLALNSGKISQPQN